MEQQSREELIRWAFEVPERAVEEQRPPEKRLFDQTVSPEKPAEMPISEPATSQLHEATVKAFPPGTCPNDGQPFQELGGALRCQACGLQKVMWGPPGVSRAEYASGEWRRRAG